MKTLFFLLLSLGFLVRGQGSLYPPGAYQYDEEVYDYDDNDDDYSDEDDDKVVTVPVIISQPRIIQAVIGHDIILPCTVDNLPESLSMLWSYVAQPAVILSMGSKVISPDYYSRAVVNISDSGSTLILHNITREDSGQYKCSVAVQGDDPPSIVHTVTIENKENVNKSVNISTAETELHYSSTTLSSTITNSVSTISAVVGDDILLSCHTTAIHTPTMYWSREGDKMPTGEAMLAGASITLYSVSLHDSGVYVCTASDSNNTPVSSKIIVSIGHNHDSVQGQVLRRSSGNTVYSPALIYLVCIWYSSVETSFLSVS